MTVREQELELALTAATNGLASAIRVLAGTQAAMPVSEETFDPMILDAETLLHECRKVLTNAS